MLTRYSNMSWKIRSSGFNGRLGRNTAFLLNWTLYVRRCEKVEDDILGTLAAGKTP